MCKRAERKISKFRAVRYLELRIPPVALALAFALAMWAVARVLSAASYRLPGAPVIALGLAVAGGGISLAGLLTFRRHRTTVNPTKPEAATSIVTDGIYRFTRNPMYLGLVLALAAWAICLANMVALLLLPVFVAYMNEFQIKSEERALLARFGSRYADYVTAVRRWL